MKREYNKRWLLDAIVDASLEVLDHDDIIRNLIDLYEERKDINWLLYDLVDAGYGSDELEEFGFSSEDIEIMGNRSMHGLGPE